MRSSFIKSMSFLSIICFILFSTKYGFAVEPSNEFSLSQPNIISSHLDSLKEINFKICDDNGIPIRGIKVNKITLEQNNKLIAVSENIDSYSEYGEYDAHDLTFSNSFEIENGDNQVDIVFYLFDKEVARIKNYTISVFSGQEVVILKANKIGKDSAYIGFYLEIINADPDDDVVVTLKTLSGDVVAQQDELYLKDYDNEHKILNIKSNLSIENMDYLNFSTLKLSATLNGKELEFYDKLSNIEVSDEPEILYYNPEKNGNRYEYFATGINILDRGNSPERSYFVKVFQNGVETGIVDTYFQGLSDDNNDILVFDITDALKEKGEKYTVILFDIEDNKIDEHTFLDNYTAYPDIINPEDEYPNYKFFSKKLDIDKFKTWTISLSSKIDISTLEQNVYIINKSSKQKLDTTLEQKDSKILVHPPSSGYTSGETYTLYIESELKSASGQKITTPAVMDFMIK